MAPEHTARQRHLKLLLGNFSRLVGLRLIFSFFVEFPFSHVDNVLSVEGYQEGRIEREKYQSLSPRSRMLPRANSRAGQGLLTTDGFGGIGERSLKASNKFQTTLR